jgi:hypothetical protein
LTQRHGAIPDGVELGTVIHARFHSVGGGEGDVLHGVWTTIGLAEDAGATVPVDAYRLEEGEVSVVSKDNWSGSAVFAAYHKHDRK